MQKCRLSADTWLTLTRSIQLLDACRNDTFDILWSNIDDADTIPTSESIVIFLTNYGYLSRLFPKIATSVYCHPCC